MLASAPVFGSGASMKDFMESHGVSQQIQNRVINSSSFDGCFSTPDYFICAIKGKYANLESNALARQSVLNALAIKVRHALYVKMLDSSNLSAVKDKKEADSVYLSQVGADNKKYLLKGIEFGTYFANGVCHAYAASPINKSVDAIEKNLSSDFFINDYCKSFFIKAVDLMSKKDYSAALVILKELHDLHFADINAYLLASEAFFKTGQTVDALKIANEVMTEFSDKMNNEQAENLGDIFMDLKQDKEAQKAYEIALARS